ncbi:MAG: glycosyltransferase [Patescibacteria group bacterium]
MKVAILHDYLNQYGGAERVLEELIGIFPGAHIYTLFYDPELTRGKFEGEVRGTSFLDWDLVRRHHRPFIPLMPLAAEGLKIKDRYDLVVSASAGFAKGIRHNPETFHLSYCHTPLRYAWEVDTYFSNPVYRTAFRPAFEYLKWWDHRVGQRPDAIVANSEFIREKIRRYYGREVTVAYPPVDYRKFYHDPRIDHPAGYYLAAGRLLDYKKFDLVLEAFCRLDLPLKIVGAGREAKRLSRQAAETGARNVTFFPFVSDRELRSLYAKAEALVFPQVEDFGLVAAEAQACGTPVIALEAGGAREIVLPGVTGIFFSEQTPEGLMRGVRQFLGTPFDREEVARVSARFTKKRFKDSILAVIPERLRDI